MTWRRGGAERAIVPETKDAVYSTGVERRFLWKSNTIPMGPEPRSYGSSGQS